MSVIVCINNGYILDISLNDNAHPCKHFEQRLLKNKHFQFLSKLESHEPLRGIR